MKTILLHSILVFLTMGTAYSQIESFEGETHKSTSFTVDGVNFTTTGDLIVEVEETFGCDTSDSYLGTGIGDGLSSGLVGTIKVTNLEDKFTISTTLPWCVFTTDDIIGDSGGVTFIGTLSNGEIIEESFSVVVPNSFPRVYDQINFSSEIWANQELIELGAVISPNLNYLALDNIAFENLLTTSIINLPEKAINIFPNPTVGEIAIINMDVLEVRIMDALGRIVSTPSLLNQKIDVSNLQDGIYHMVINTPDQQITKRIIKQ